MGKTARWVLYMHNGQRFYPVDWSRGECVRNKIFASLFTDEEKEAAQRDLDLPDNSTIVYQWRPIQTQRNPKMTKFDPARREPQVSPDTVAVPPLTHALSIREPYAYLVSSGWKPVEVRSVPFPKNRPLPVWIAIHASLSSDDINDVELILDLVDLDKELGSILTHEYWRENPMHRLFARSEIIGAMRVVASVPGENPTEEQFQSIRDAWHGRTDRLRTGVDPKVFLADDGWNWIVDDAVRFKNPIVCKGLLNVWAMNPEVARLANAQMRLAMNGGGLDRHEAYGVPTVYEVPKGYDKKSKELMKTGAA